MNAKMLKRILILMVCVIIALSGIATVSAATEYTISELDDMIISLPDDMSAITRSSKSSDRYFSVYGADYKTTMQKFENNNIYLQAMDSMSSVTFTVTMTKTSESESISNYTKLSQDELTKVRNNFLNMSEFSTCTPDEKDKFIWFIFNSAAKDNGKTINTYQGNTVYDGMNINITFQRNEGNVTAIDYDIFSQIISSIDFRKGNMTVDMLSYIVIGGTVVIVILIILIIIFARRIRKRRRNRKNDAILEELANKYNLTDDSRNNYDIEDSDEKPKRLPDSDAVGSDEKQNKTQKEQPKPVSFEDIASRYSSDDEIDDIINTARAYKESLNREALKNNYGYEENSTELEKKKELTEADTSDNGFEESQEYEDISSNSSNNSCEADVKNTDSDDNSNSADDTDDTENYDDTDTRYESSNEKYASVFFGTDTSTEDEDENDEELIRQVASRARFDNGYDFFEEAPKKVRGVLNSSDIKNATDYDVIVEEEQKAEEVKTQGEKGDNPVLKALAKTGKGLKSAGIHFGYFCKNVSIMIKRKRAASKRRKAEEQRRELERQKAVRARQRREEQRENGGLVRVHSKGSSQNNRPRGGKPQSRYPQGKSQARPQNRRPQGKSQARPQNRRPQGKSQARPQNRRPQSSRPDKN